MAGVDRPALEQVWAVPRGDTNESDKADSERSGSARPKQRNSLCQKHSTEGLAA
jgi:hypothetical protein